MNAIGSEDRRNQAPEAKPWVRRLVKDQKLPLNEKAMGWWSVHLDGFLSYAVKRGERLEVVILARGYLQMLQETLPPSASFRLDQTRQALTVFVRGIKNWHWEETPDGALRPRFRLKQGVMSTQRPVIQRESPAREVARSEGDRSRSASSGGAGQERDPASSCCDRVQQWSDVEVDVWDRHASDGSGATQGHADRF